MAKGYGKWIGGGLGWILGGGPLGALVGVALGSLFDIGDSGNESERINPSQQRSTSSGDFYLSLLVLSAAVMKADGRHLKSELDFIKQFLKQNFGVEKTKEYLRVLKELLEQDIPLRQVCIQITQHTPHAYRLQIMHYLYGIAQADGSIDAREEQVLQQIANYLNISSADAASLKAMFVKNTDSAYTILEIDKSASDDELKKAYRKMAAKYHPDKVASLGEDAMKAAQEKFRMVNQAYEEIKKERGLR